MSSDLLPRGLLANGAMGTLSEISCLFATIRHNYRHHSRQHWNNEQRRCGRLWRVLSPRYGAQGSLKGVPVGPLGHPYCPYRLPISIGWKSKSSPPVGPWVAPRFDEIKYQVLPSPLHLSPQIVVVITNGLYMLMKIMRFENWHSGRWELLPTTVSPPGLGSFCHSCPWANRKFCRSVQDIRCLREKCEEGMH